MQKKRKINASKFKYENVKYEKMKKKKEFKGSNYEIIGNSVI